METILIFLFLVLAAGFSLIFWMLRKNLKNPPAENQSFLMIQNQINEINHLLDSRLNESTRLIQANFGENLKVIRDVTEKLTKLDETNKQVINFADQLSNLQDILKNPKQRGVLGEYYLKTVLENVLPPGVFQMQYEFKDGTIVDAAVFVKDKIIPVDSKFSLENYNRILESRGEERERFESAFVQDLKNRIDETSKYIKPEEGTMEFAFMFIPSEAVYYDLLINKVGALKANTRDLISYAAEKKVMVVSPTTFLAYLQTVLQGLKALQIEESAKEIMKNVGQLEKHLKAYEDFHNKLGNQLHTAVNTYNNTSKELNKINKDIFKISGRSPELEPLMLENQEDNESN